MGPEAPQPDAPGRSFSISDISRRFLQLNSGEPQSGPGEAGQDWGTFAQRMSGLFKNLCPACGTARRKRCGHDSRNATKGSLRASLRTSGGRRLSVRSNQVVIPDDEPARLRRDSILVGSNATWKLRGRARNWPQPGVGWGTPGRSLARRAATRQPAPLRPNGQTPDAKRSEFAVNRGS